jgi:osmotically-inducible protein OsmY
MNRKLRYFLPTLLLCVVSAFGQNDKSVSADGRISDQVRMRLATDPDVKGGALDVIVKDGEVTLRGRVDTEKGKKKAEKLAKKVKGVKAIDNELVVGPPTQ